MRDSSASRCLGGIGLLAVCAIVGGACGGPAGTAPGTTGGGGDSGSGGDDGGGTGDDGGTAYDGGPCSARTSATQAVHVSMNVTWPGTIATQAGQGVVHVWTRSKITFNPDNTVTAVNSACGSVIPDIQETFVAGGQKVRADFPDSLWDAPSMPTFPATGTQSGWDVGSSVSSTASPVLLGLTMQDPNGPWPALANVQAADSDGDGHPGITSVPKNGGGYSLPPTSLLQTDHADQLYIASRTTTSLAGKRDSCDSHKGTATVTAFDNHVIGCHVAGKGDCAQADYQFIDTNRTVYTVTGATYVAKIVADGATCADVRTALPAN